MRSEAGETELLPTRAWGHRRQTCQREIKISGEGVPEVWMAGPSSPEPGVAKKTDPGEVFEAASRVGFVREMAEHG
jgi:hypothetical protein